MNGEVEFCLENCKLWTPCQKSRDTSGIYIVALVAEETETIRAKIITTLEKSWQMAKPATRSAIGS
jgi:hypothetical protein